MAISFGFTSGFLCHFWYKYLDQKIPGNSIRIITRKILWDQIFFSPILIVACLAVAGVIDKSTKKEIETEIRDKGELSIWLSVRRSYLMGTRLGVPLNLVNNYK